MPLPHEIIETNGTRPFANRPRRPLVGDAFNKPQMEHLAKLEARIAALEARRPGEAPVAALTQADDLPAGPPNIKEPTGTFGTLQPVRDALVKADKEREDEALAAVATPAMLALISEAPTPELRATLTAIAKEDKPAQVRLAAMRKAAQPPTP